MYVLRKLMYILRELKHFPTLRHITRAISQISHEAVCIEVAVPSRAQQIRDLICIPELNIMAF